MKIEKKKEKVNEYEVDRKGGRKIEDRKRKRQLMNMRQIERVGERKKIEKKKEKINDYETDRKSVRKK